MAEPKAKRPLVEIAEDSPLSRTPKWVRYILVGVALVFLLFVLLAIFAPDPEESGEAPASVDFSGDAIGSNELTVPIEVTTDDLAKAYDENEMAAQQRFGGRWLRVTGTVRSIALDISDEPIVNFESSTLLPIQATFVDEAMASTGTLKKGQIATLFCSEVSEVLGTPMLGGCEIATE